MTSYPENEIDHIRFAHEQHQKQVEPIQKSVGNYRRTKPGIAICPFFTWTSEDIEGEGHSENDVNLIHCIHPKNSDPCEGNCYPTVCPLLSQVEPNNADAMRAAREQKISEFKVRENKESVKAEPPAGNKQQKLKVTQVPGGYVDSDGTLGDGPEPPKPVQKDDGGDLWQKGSTPKQSGWYIIRYMSKDNPPVVIHEKVWFNPDSVEKWWLGSVGKVRAFLWGNFITHYIGFDEACDCLDALERQSKYWFTQATETSKERFVQQQEIERLKFAVAFREKDATVYRNKIAYLTAENAKLILNYDQLQEINATHCERADWFENQNKALAERVDKLEGLLHRGLSYIVSCKPVTDIVAKINQALSEERK